MSLLIFRELYKQLMGMKEIAFIGSETAIQRLAYLAKSKNSKKVIQPLPSGLFYQSD